MKLTKTRLKQIIKEEIAVLFEVATKDHEKPVNIDIAKKESEDGVFVTLVTLVELMSSGTGTQKEVGGIRTIAGKPEPMTLTVAITENPGKESLDPGQGPDADKVFVPERLIGLPFSYENYNFVVEYTK